MGGVCGLRHPLSLDTRRALLTFSAPHPAAPNPRGQDASLPHPQLQPAPCRRCRRAGAAVGMGPSQARSWPVAVHRSARSLRHHPGGVPAREGVLRRGRGRAAGERADGDGPCGGAQRRDHQSQARHRRGRAGGGRAGAGIAGRDPAAAGQQRARVSRGDPAALPLSGSAPRGHAPQHPAALAGHLQRSAGGWRSRVSSSSRPRS